MNYETLHRRMHVLSLVIILLGSVSCKSDAKAEASPTPKTIETEVAKTETSPDNTTAVDPVTTTVSETKESAPVASTTTTAKKNIKGLPSGKKVKAQPTNKKKSNVSKPTASSTTPTEPNPPVVPNETKTEKPENPPVTGSVVGLPNHKLLDKILSKYVSGSGTVDYAAIKSNEAKFDAYLATLESSEISSTWSREDKLAFWINAYNAYTIKLILNNYPVKKITDLHGGKPWDHKWIKLDGKTLSLNNIENDIIRPTYKEPRIHFAVNCAAKSCPPLLNAAYEPSTLDAQLESQTKKFINNEKYNSLGKDAVKVSKIFDWYGVDFGDVAAYVAKYADKTVKPSASVSFNDYDWSLNGK